MGDNEQYDAQEVIESLAGLDDTTAQAFAEQYHQELNKIHPRNDPPSGTIYETINRLDGETGVERDYLARVAGELNSRMWNYQHREAIGGGQDIADSVSAYQEQIAEMEDEFPQYVEAVNAVISEVFPAVLEEL